MQDTKSQAQNQRKGLEVAPCSVVRNAQKAKIDAERAEARNSMIGSGSRAEKIRTYQVYKDNLIVDHRVLVVITI